MEMSLSGLFPLEIPDRDAMAEMIGVKRSVSKLFLLPCKTAVILSSPMPVSILGLGRGVRVPNSSRLNCMNTRFQSSKYLSQSHPTPQSVFPHPTSSPWSMIISEQGPHGPVSPICQKLSFAPSLTILLWGRSVSSFHSFSASSSSWYTVTHNLSFGSAYGPVRSSHAKTIASFLK